MQIINRHNDNFVTEQLKKREQERVFKKIFHSLIRNCYANVHCSSATIAKRMFTTHPQNLHKSSLTHPQPLHERVKHKDASKYAKFTHKHHKRSSSAHYLLAESRLALWHSLVNSSRKHIKLNSIVIC